MTSESAARLAEHIWGGGGGGVEVGVGRARPLNRQSGWCVLKGQYCQNAALCCDSSQPRLRRKLSLQHAQLTQLGSSHTAVLETWFPVSHSVSAPGAPGAWWEDSEISGAPRPTPFSAAISSLVRSKLSPPSAEVLGTALPPSTLDPIRGQAGERNGGQPTRAQAGSWVQP